MTVLSTEANNKKPKEERLLVAQLHCNSGSVTRFLLHIVISGPLLPCADSSSRRSKYSCTLAVIEGRSFLPPSFPSSPSRILLCDCYFVLGVLQFEVKHSSVMVLHAADTAAPGACCSVITTSGTGSQ